MAKEFELEVFRGDTRASRGITSERLKSVVDYDCAANPIGCVIGHPKNDSPAVGTITGFRLDGSKLIAKIKDAKDALIQGIKDGTFLNRSMAFFDEEHEANPTPGKLAPRHLGFLGASAPGIPGMTPLSKALAFAADDDGDDIIVSEGDPADAVIFAAEPTAALTVFEAKEPTMSGTPTPPATPTPEQLAEREREFTAREEAFAARERSAFEAGNARIVDGLVTAGKVLPAEVDKLKLVFNALGTDELEFTAADGKPAKSFAATELAAFLDGALPKRVPLGNKPASPSALFTADDKPTDPGVVTAKARALMAERPGLAFEAAVAEVSGETE